MFTDEHVNNDSLLIHRCLDSMKRNSAMPVMTTLVLGGMAWWQIVGMFVKQLRLMLGH